jgi:pimeloyl-ACP methyl ester carboxylesterase
MEKCQVRIESDFGEAFDVPYHPPVKGCASDTIMNSVSGYLRVIREKSCITESERRTMWQEEISVENKEIILKGTLAKPDMTAPYPVVVATHTSHAGTRDFGVYQHLAELLTAHGVAVFLFDRRGSGESSGSFETATFSDLAADVRGAINCLKSRDDIDARRIGLWGMSQGGWIAPLVTAESKDVTFLIAVSAVGVSPAEQMNYSAEYQLREKGYSPDAVSQMLALRGIVDAYYRGDAARSAAQARLDAKRSEPWFPLAYLSPTLPDDPAVAKWYQEMDYDPRPVMQEVRVPVLLIYGEIDPWVPIEKSVSQWRKFGPEDTTVKHIKDANHFMISIDQSGAYESEGEIVTAYSDVLTQWLKQFLEQGIRNVDVS